MSDQVQDVAYSKSEVQMVVAALQLQTSAPNLELEMDATALELEADAAGLKLGIRTSWSGIGDGDRRASGDIEAGEVFGWLGVVDAKAAAYGSISIEVRLHWTLLVTPSRIVSIVSSGGTLSFRSFEFSCTMSTLTTTLDDVLI
jgi:hypothetical protein